VNSVASPEISRDFFDATRVGWHVLFAAMDVLGGGDRQDQLYPRATALHFPSAARIVVGAQSRRIEDLALMIFV